MDRERLDIERIKQKWDERYALYKTTRGELGLLFDKEMTADIYGAFPTLQIWSDYVMGYVSSIKNESYLREEGDHWKKRALESLMGLRRNDLFHDVEFREWYTRDIDRWPHIKAYIELVDHIRLLGINYLEMYVLKRYGIAWPQE